MHIGDGFKFLADNQSTCDIIISDTSPIGLVESIIQMPYFRLLHAAHAAGGTSPRRVPLDPPHSSLGLREMTAYTTMPAVHYVLEGGGERL